MNIKSNKGAFTTVFVLVVVSLMTVFLLGFHKNISSFLEIEENTKKKSSTFKIKQALLKSLYNYSSCTKTFKHTEEFVTSIKNLYGTEVFKLNANNARSFYKESGFYEKTGFIVKKIKIIESNPKNFNSKDFKFKKSCEASNSHIPMETYTDSSSMKHSIATLKIFFSRDGTEECSYLPIYIKQLSNDIKSCSTSQEALSKFVCNEQTVKVICCRYIYNLRLKPSHGKESFDIANAPYIVRANNTNEAVGIISSTEDLPGQSLKDGAWEECKSEDHLGKVIGYCTFRHNWILTSDCVS